MMGALKHTPGPWIACDPGEYSDYDARSIVILGDDKRIVIALNDDAEAIANARLIAAAPHLLEALQFVLSAHGEQLHDAIAAARAAIAAATGETPHEGQ